MELRFKYDDYVIFKKPIFDFVLPDTTYNQDEIIDTVSIFASPDEYEPATFVIRANKNLRDVTVTAINLVNENNIIPKENIDIRVVKVWLQGGLNLKIDAPEGVLVPELLLYNDNDKLTGGFEGDTYTAPIISTRLRTNITKDDSKQFWITVHVPDNTPPGNYTSTLTISANNVASRDITLKVNVLPITLQKPKQWYLIYFKPFTGMRSISDEVLEKQLIDLKKHGFNGFRAPVTDEELRKILDYSKTLEFEGPIIVSYDRLETQIPILEEYGYESYVYGQDEPNLYNQPSPEHSLRHHIRKSYDIHQGNGKVVTAIYKEISDELDKPESSAYDQIDPKTDLTFREQDITNEKLDLANYHANGLSINVNGLDYPLWNYIQEIRSGSIQKSTNKNETYYWQCWGEKPKLNRLEAGFFLWTSKLDGIMPYVYQGSINFDRWGDPFNDFDTQPAGKNYKDMMTTYPSAKGPIPTTKWEALREGYDDVRYLTTLFNLIETLDGINPSLANQIENEINLELEKYYNPQDYKILSGNDFQNTRWLIAQRIIEIQHLLSCGNKVCEPEFGETIENCPEDCIIPTTSSTITTSTTTTIPSCSLDSAYIVCNCGLDNECSSGESISVYGAISGPCPIITHLQIDASNYDGACDIQYTGVDVSGIYGDYPSLSGSILTDTWMVPTIPQDCEGETITASYGGIYKDGSPVSGIWIDNVLAAGECKFFKPSATTTTIPTTTTTSTTTTSTSTTTTIEIEYPIETLDTQMLDSNHNPVSSIQSGQQYYIRTTIENTGAETKNPILVIQIKNSKGEVVGYVSSLKSNIAPGRINYLEVGYVAGDPDDYTAEVFVWSNWPALGGEPLASSSSKTFTVSE